MGHVLLSAVLFEPLVLAVSPCLGGHVLVCAPASARSGRVSSENDVSYSILPLFYG
jgi:hypothetical protein